MQLVKVFTFTVKGRSMIKWAHRRKEGRGREREKLGWAGRKSSCAQGRKAGVPQHQGVRTGRKNFHQNQQIHQVSPPHSGRVCPRNPALCHPTSRWPAYSCNNCEVWVSSRTPALLQTLATLETEFCNGLESRTVAHIFPSSTHERHFIHHAEMLQTTGRVCKTASRSRSCHLSSAQPGFCKTNPSLPTGGFNPFLLQNCSLGAAHANILMSCVTKHDGINFLQPETRQRDTEKWIVYSVSNET